VRWLLPACSRRPPVARATQLADGPVGTASRGAPLAYFSRWWEQLEVEVESIRCIKEMHRIGNANSQQSPLSLALGSRAPLGSPASMFPAAPASLRASKGPDGPGPWRSQRPLGTLGESPRRFRRIRCEVAANPQNASMTRLRVLAGMSRNSGPGRRTGPCSGPHRCRAQLQWQIDSRAATDRTTDTKDKKTPGFSARGLAIALRRRHQYRKLRWTRNIALRESWLPTL
jgi:hypothetical protein